MGITYQIYNLHVTLVVTWRLYHLHNYKLQASYNTLPNCDCEHVVLHYQNYRSQLCFLRSSWMDFVLHISAEFFANWVSIRVHISLAFVGFINMHSFTICGSFLVLNWDPHACCGQDMFFYNCYTCKQILVIVLNKMPSF